MLLLCDGGMLLLSVVCGGEYICGGRLECVCGGDVSDGECVECVEWGRVVVWMESGAGCGRLQILALLGVWMMIGMMSGF